MKFSKDCRKILVLNYNGLGDLVSLAPGLMEILRSKEIEKLYINENLFLQYIINKFFIKFKKKVFFLPSNLRKLDKSNFLLFLDFIDNNGVDTLIDFRFDISRVNSFNIFLNKLNDRKLNYFVLEDFIPLNKLISMHFTQMHSFLISGVLDYQYEYQTGWLKKLIQITPNANKIGIFLGASKEIKKVPIEIIIKIVVLLNKYGLIPIIIRGDSNDTEYENFVIEKLKALKLKFRIKSFMKINNLIGYLSRNIKGLITGDTFLLHLAEALGISVFAIFISTNYMIYGPLIKFSKIFYSKEYFDCKKINIWGNCKGWDEGCDNPVCRLSIIKKDELVDVFDDFLKINILKIR